MKELLFVARAERTDVDALAALATACHSHPWTVRQIAQEIDSPSAVVLVVRSAAPGRAHLVCGSCAYRIVVDELEIDDVAVHPRWRRRGIGRSLVRLALAQARRCHVSVARLEVRAGNTAALELYRSMGFARCGRRREYYRQPVEDAVLMELRLAGQLS